MLGTPTYDILSPPPILGSGHRYSQSTEKWLVQRQIQWRCAGSRQARGLLRRAEGRRRAGHALTRQSNAPDGLRATSQSGDVPESAP